MSDQQVPMLKCRRCEHEEPIKVEHTTRGRIHRCSGCGLEMRLMRTPQPVHSFPHRRLSKKERLRLLWTGNETARFEKKAPSPENLIRVPGEAPA